jgi:hypothetical protein
LSGGGCGAREAAGSGGGDDARGRGTEADGRGKGGGTDPGRDRGGVGRAGVDAAAGGTRGPADGRVGKGGGVDTGRERRPGRCANGLGGLGRVTTGGPLPSGGSSTRSEPLNSSGLAAGGSGMPSSGKSTELLISSMESWSGGGGRGWRLRGGGSLPDGEGLGGGFRRGALGAGP